MFKRNEAVLGLCFSLVSKATGDTITSGAVTAFLVIDGGTQVTLSATPSYKGQGVWSISLTAEETDGAVLGLTFVQADALPATLTIKTIVNVIADNMVAEAPTVAEITADFDANSAVLSAISVVLTAVQAKTSQMTFSVPNQLDSNVLSTTASSLTSQINLGQTPQVQDAELYAELSLLYDAIHILAGN